MKNKNILWLAATLAILAVAVWFLYRPKSQTQHQSVPATNSTTPANSAIQAPASNAVIRQASAVVPDTNLQNAEADIAARYKQGLINKGQVMQEEIDLGNKKPLDIYGKVIDQYGNSVVGAKVEGGILLAISPVSSGGESHTTETDANGRFSFLGIHGVKLGIRPQKDGYIYNYRLPSTRPDNYEPDPNDPLVFTMWKLRGAEPLVGSSIDANIPHDGTTVAFEIATGKVSPTGDLRVTLSQFPLDVKRGRDKFDWSVKVEIINGGLVGENDSYPYWAPEIGYQSSFEFNVSSNAFAWVSNLKTNFYVKNAQGQYGKMQFNIYPGRSPTGIEAGFTINPSGSQNLEPAPEK